MKIITKDYVEIVGLRKVWLAIAAIAIVIGAVFMIVNGFNLDTDFAGGITLQYNLHKTLDKAELDSIRELVNDVNGITVNTIQKSGDDSSCVIIKAADATPEVVKEVYRVLNIKYGAPVAETENKDTSKTDDSADKETNESTDGDETDDSTDDGSAEAQPSALSDESGTEQKDTVYGGTQPIEVLSESRIGASISKEIRNSAITATSIAVILMLLYISVRFQIRSAVAAVVCLIHDIFIVISVYSILGIPVSSNIIAVLLTILGYSINATIVIFDRIRENTKKMGRTDFGQIVNISTRQTLLRSVNTTITTLLTIGMVYLLGVHSIKEFALPLIVGIIAGLYSSVFLSGTFWYILSPKHKAK